ncbi:Zinc carboxypeptidase [Chryseolinea serpens]|uniref:Zinc carboxypeptidase n=1 Tax=Chryseolinea serpens TaxID=947013 RepID=A0A1M5XT66_9BACT|nr:M14 family zinc carboxypeptidase [Chryseolinea serpens]SHI03025.1 Zinc carboxypeptidase [Chryseolinea serpens]
MKSKLSRSGLLLLLFVAFSATAQDRYYFPKGNFDPAIPSPEKFLGYPIGSHYTRHDRIVDYFKELDRLSDKVTVKEIGKTYEERVQIIATVTSPENHGKLESIRLEHLKLVDPKAAEPDYKNLPVFVHLGYSVHGNETSSGEAALLTFYYLVASQDEETQKFLREAVVTFDPSVNPDGRDRAAAWHNQNKSFPPVTDPLDREHTELWPMGRTNHFLFDLNRDWLAAVHVESKNRLNFYHTWYPNVQIDFHEMGTNSTYYFEPSKPYGSESAIIPRETYDVLNVKLAKYHAEALNSVGSLYWTKEQFDNLSAIYGSTYPDFQGAVGITFEVGSSRGLAQESNQGVVTFPFTIRNHVLTGIATVRGAVAEKDILLRHQRKFFSSALEDAKKNPNKAFVFGSSVDETINQKFLSLLLTHKLEVYETSGTTTVEGKRFEKGKSYIVPTAQPHYRIVHSLFEEVTHFHDSVFYDVTGWAVAHGYGVPFARIKDANVALGTRVTAVKKVEGQIENGKSDYAYLLNWSDYNASKALYALQQYGLLTKVSFKPFTVEEKGVRKEFPQGTIVVPVAWQKISADSLFRVVKEVTTTSKVSFTAVSTGFNAQGIDLGSNNIRALEKPEAALLVGQGTNSAEVGQLWFLLNKQVDFSITKIDISNAARIDWTRYNVLVLVGGNYSALDKNTVAKLKSWIEQGNTLITIKNASEWAVKQGLVTEKLVTEYKPDTTQINRFDFIKSNEIEGPKSIEGSIYSADLDITHPLGFGFESRKLYVFRNGSTFLKSGRSPYGTVVKYTANPLVSGYVSKANLKRIANSASVVVSNAGRGRVILFADDPYFRGYWYGTARLFLNALFFGQVVNNPSLEISEAEHETH